MKIVIVRKWVWSRDFTDVCLHMVTTGKELETDSTQNRITHTMLQWVNHMVVTTIMRWQLLEALLSRSRATRKRWQRGKMCQSGERKGGRDEDGSD